MEEQKAVDVVFATSQHKDLLMRGIPREMQTRGSGEVSETDKSAVRDHLQFLKLKKDPAIYLERYGRLLRKEHVAYFAEAFPQNEEVGYHVRELIRKFASAAADLRQRQQLVRNRRFAYLEQVLRKSDYFTVEKMQERAPYLYETTVIGFARVRPTRFAEDMPLSERLLSNIDSDRSPKISPLLIDLVTARFEAQKQEDTQFAEQEEEEDEAEDEDKEQLADAEQVSAQLGEAAMKVAHEDEKETHFMHNQFIKMMEKRFLDGEDAEFVDYRAIDHDANLDNLEQIGRDKQDEYFDDM